MLPLYPQHRTQGKANAINLDQFINFLNEKQRDPRLNEILYPLYDEKRALEIINTYEQNDEAREASKCGRGFECLACSTNKVWLFAF